VIAAWPSFALIGAYELLMRQVRRSAAGEGRPQRRRPAPRVYRPEDDSDAAPRLRRSSGPASGNRRAGRGEASRELHLQAWRWALAHRAGDGSLPSGSEIARQYGRHERWGRLVEQAGAAGEFDDGEFSEPGLRLVQPATPSAAPE